MPCASSSRSGARDASSPRVNKRAVSAATTASGGSRPAPRAARRVRASARAGAGAARPPQTRRAPETQTRRRHGFRAMCLSRHHSRHHSSRHLVYLVCLLCLTNAAFRIVSLRCLRARLRARRAPRRVASFRFFGGSHLAREDRRRRSRRARPAPPPRPCHPRARARGSGARRGHPRPRRPRPRAGPAHATATKAAKIPGSARRGENAGTRGRAPEPRPRVPAPPRRGDITSPRCAAEDLGESPEQNAARTRRGVRSPATVSARKMERWCGLEVVRFATANRWGNRDTTRRVVRVPVQTSDRGDISI